jgi:hypothetical protein
MAGMGLCHRPCGGQAHCTGSAVESPTESKPAKFTEPVNLLKGYRWNTAALDSQTAAYIRHVEIGGAKVESPDEQSDDDESINTCATVAEVAAQRAADLADPNMDESLDERVRTVKLLPDGNYTPR